MMISIEILIVDQVPFSHRFAHNTLTKIYAVAILDYAFVSIVFEFNVQHAFDFI